MMIIIAMSVHRMCILRCVVMVNWVFDEEEKGEGVYWPGSGTRQTSLIL